MDNPNLDNREDQKLAGCLNLCDKTLRVVGKKFWKNVFFLSYLEKMPFSQENSSLWGDVSAKRGQMFFLESKNDPLKNKRWWKKQTIVLSREWYQNNESEKDNPVIVISAPSSNQSVEVCPNLFITCVNTKDYWGGEGLILESENHRVLDFFINENKLTAIVVGKYETEIALSQRMLENGEVVTNLSIVVPGVSDFFKANNVVWKELPPLADFMSWRINKLTAITQRILYYYNKTEDLSGRQQVKLDRFNEKCFGWFLRPIDRYLRKLFGWVPRWPGLEDPNTDVKKKTE